MSAHQTGPRGMTAFVPNGDSRRDTATLLLAAAEDMGFDQSAHIASTGKGFYISDEFAEKVQDYDPDAYDPDAESNPEAQKAVDQLEAEVPPVENAEEAVDEAIQPDVSGNVGREDTDTHDPADPDEAGDKSLTEAEDKPKRKRASKTSGNRAGKQDSEEE